MSAKRLDAEATLQQLLSQLDNLRETETRATGARMASLVGHLIGTPLNVIIGRAALIRADPSSPEAVERNARRIEEQVVKLSGRIRSLLEYLTPKELPSGASSLRQLVNDALALYRPIATHAGIRLDSIEEAAELDGISRAHVSRAHVSDARVFDGHAALVVVSALLSMAIRAAEPGALLGLRYARKATMGSFELTAPGLALPPDPIDSLEPSSEADPASRMQWQVLSVCSSLATRLGGHLSVESVHGVCTVRFSCPLA